MSTWRPLLTELARIGAETRWLEWHEARAWASITFAGERHRLRYQFTGAEAVEAGERFIAALPDHQFAVAGHVVTDAKLTNVCHNADPAWLEVMLEILVLEEG